MRRPRDATLMNVIKAGVRPSSGKRPGANRREWMLRLQSIFPPLEFLMLPTREMDDNAPQPRDTLNPPSQPERAPRRSRAV